MLNIHLLGEFVVSYNGELITGMDNMRPQSLLAYLLLHRNAPQARRHLAYTFWPDSSERQARTNLRRELHYLRQVLPTADRFLKIDNKTLQWRNDSPYTLDVAEFEQTLDSVRQTDQTLDARHRITTLEDAVGLYKGSLLPACYDEWIYSERARLHAVYLQALDQLVAELEMVQDYPNAIRYARRYQREDILQETTYQKLMRLHALNGDRASALRTYHSCATILQKELGVEPDEATIHIYEQILNSSFSPATRPQRALSFRTNSSMVNRRSEWQQLQRIWQQTAVGQIHLVIVSGDPGIGKSRLVEELMAWVRQQGALVAQARAYAAGGALAYSPLTDWLRSLMQPAQGFPLDAVWLTEIARLLPELLSLKPELPAPEPLTESWQRQRLFEALARAILSHNCPLLLVLDNLQWTDQETLAWLDYLLRSNRGSPLLVAATLRSNEIGADHQLMPLLLYWRSTELLTEISLAPFDEMDTLTLAEQIADKEISEDWSAHLFNETEGNPLFIIETIRATDDQYTTQIGSTVPPKVQSVIEARLAQLSAPAFSVAKVAATIGRAFVFDVLAEASQEDEDTLVQGLDELWQRGIIREQNDNDYDFSHDKLREVVYHNLSAANKRILHRRVAVALEMIFCDNLDSVSGQIAVHFELGGSIQKAISYYWHGGEVERQIYANEKAIHHYEKGLALLKTMPDTSERARRELNLQLSLSISYRITRGHADDAVGQALSRARILCRQLGQTEKLGPVLWGLYAYNFVRSNLDQALDLSKELFTLAKTVQNPAFHQQAHNALGGTLTALGDFTNALSHFQEGLALYDVEQHQILTGQFGVDLGIFSQSWSTHPLWHLGFLDQSIERIEKTLALAKALHHPYSQTLAMAYAAMLFQFKRDSNLVLEWAEETIDLCREQGVSYYDSWAVILRGWALAEQGFPQEGIPQIQNGLDTLRKSNSQARLPYYLTLLAEAYGYDEHYQKGLMYLREALTLADRNGDCWYNAESLRLMGKFLLQLGEFEEGEAYLKRALANGRDQQAKVFQLRAAISLSQLWQQQNRPLQGRQMVATILDSFNEGFDTLELKNAQRHLDLIS